MNAILLEQTTSHLVRQVRRWDRRLRAVESLVWVPRGLILGLAVGVAAALVARLWPWLLPEQVAVMAAVAIVAGAGGALAAVWAWPRSTARVARHFDRRFALRERISTALELAAGIIPYPDHLAERQLSDATQAAQRVNAAAHLPARVRWREVALLIVLAGLLAYLLLADNPQADELRARRALQQAIANQAAQVEEMIETIQENPELSAEEQAALTEPLQEALDILREPDITQQEAVAALAEAQQSLRELGNGMLPQQTAAYQEAASALVGSERTSDLARALNRPDLGRSADALDALADDLGESDLSEQEREDLANRLDQAAEALERINPALAERLRQAADALREGDIQAAQGALREAADTLREQQRQLEQSELAQSAQSASQQMREGQQELAQAGQEQPEQLSNAEPGDTAQQTEQQFGQQQSGQPPAQEGQAGASQQEPGQQGQALTGEQQAGQPGQPETAGAQQQGEGQQAGQTGEGQQPEQGAEGEQMAQGAGEGSEQTGDAAASGDTQASAAGQQGSQPSQSGMATEGEVAGQVSAPGAGEGEGGAGADVTSGEANPEAQGEISTDNAPGDADGEIREYESEYAPSTIGGEPGESLDVGGQSSDSGGEPVQEGEFGPNPAGQSSLSYSSVYGNYQGIVSDALESGRIPLDQRDVIHDYFSSLEP